MDLKILTRPSSWCAPAMIYAVLAIFMISVIMLGSEKFGGKALASLSTKERILLSIWEVCWTFLILLAMLMACEKGYAWVSWAILIVPFIYAMGKLSGCPKDLKKENFVPDDYKKCIRNCIGVCSDAPGSKCLHNCMERCF